MNAVTEYVDRVSALVAIAAAQVKAGCRPAHL